MLSNQTISRDVLYNMEIGDILNDYSRLDVIRVPGGWLFSYIGNTNLTFVPFPEN